MSWARLVLPPIQRPPVKERYLIVLNPPKNGVPDLSDHDITAGGGDVEYKVPGRIQVLLPAPAVDGLRKHGWVRHIRKVILGPLPAPAVTGTSRLTPSVLSLHPNAEATPPVWSSGTYRYVASGTFMRSVFRATQAPDIRHWGQAFALWRSVTV